MDLLKHSELPAWLLQRFGSARRLAEALGTTRQTAHNLLTGRTAPSFDTCLKLGLEPMFMETQKQKRSAIAMNGLDDFLSQRSRRTNLVKDREAMARLLSGRAPGMWHGLQELTRNFADRVGSVDGLPFEWDPSQSLLLGYVVASFSRPNIVDNGLPRFRVVFGRNPSRPSFDDPPAREVWNLGLSLSGPEIVWSIDAIGMAGATTAEVAERIVRGVVEYRDKCEVFYATGSWPI